MSSRKLKILCLHGYRFLNITRSGLQRQDGEFFREKLGGFRKNIKNVAELVFLDAPYVIPNRNLNEDGCQRPGRGWWFSKEDDSFNPFEPTDIAKGFETSVECVANTFQSQGPFDGILGFSQGAALVALICGLKELKEFHYPFQFVILIAGFKSSSTCHEYLFQRKFQVCSLHVMGEADRVIPKDMSDVLATFFQDSQVICHSGGHFIPTGSEFKSKYLSFLKDMHIKLCDRNSGNNTT